MSALMIQARTNRLNALKTLSENDDNIFGRTRTPRPVMLLRRAA